jgi:hypothetical protein
MAKASPLPALLAAAAALLAAPTVPIAAQQLCVPDTTGAAAVLEGTVVDTVTSFPLQGAEVVLTRIAEGQTVQRKTETARTGEFRFCDVPPGASVSVRATWFDRPSESRSVAVEGRVSGIVLGVTSPYVVVTGRVNHQETGAPLPAAAVRIGATPTQLTNEEGIFRFERIPPGIWEVTIELLGFADLRDSVDVEFGTLPDLGIRLPVQAIALQPIQVTVRSLRLQQAGFYTRQTRGPGTFVTRQQIEARMPLASSDMLRRVPGVRLVRNRAGDNIAIGRGNCPYRFIIDGARIGATYSIDEMPPQWIEGLEIYHGLAQIPVEFAAAPIESNTACGLIVIWTRNRR